MNNRIQLFKGDITALSLDAIVNAANRTLLGGGGVDGAIHRAAGPQLREACRLLEGCETGRAKITPGFKLKAKWVIHTVGPVWGGGGRGEREHLRSCYHEALALAERHAIQTIAFPSISTGAHRFQIEVAVPIAVEAVSQFLKTAPSLIVTFTCFSDSDYAVYQAALT